MKANRILTKNTFILRVKLENPACFSELCAAYRLCIAFQSVTGRQRKMLQRCGNLFRSHPLKHVSLWDFFFFILWGKLEFVICFTILFASGRRKRLLTRIGQLILLTYGAKWCKMLGVNAGRWCLRPAVLNSCIFNVHWAKHSKSSQY